jgi:hypothetical protein
MEDERRTFFRDIRILMLDYKTDTTEDLMLHHVSCKNLNHRLYFYWFYEEHKASYLRLQVKQNFPDRIYTG